jgi:CspA family cold shock protein
MPVGTVTSFDANGFGFIAPDSDGGEIWVRPGDVPGAMPLVLSEGERVTFDLASGTLGIEAVNVRPVRHVRG